MSTELILASVIFVAIVFILVVVFVLTRFIGPKKVLFSCYFLFII